MNKLETREQAEQRAVELFPKVPLFHNNYVSNKTGRIGFLQCWDEMQDNSIKDLGQTCGFCVKPSKDNQRKLLSEIMREDEKDGIYEESQRMSEQSEKNNQLREAEWISVEDGLPDLNIEVWVWLKDHNTPYLFSRSNASADVWLWANHYNEIGGDGYFDDEYEVTHWKPFIKPQPPKQ